MNNIHKRLASLGVLSVDDDLIPIGFTDKNGISICVGDICKTYDFKGNEWIGSIERVDDSKVLVSSTYPVYCFSSNYQTRISNQDYASMLEIVERNGKLL